MKVRDCFKGLPSETRKLLYEKVLLKINKSHDQRDSLRNLFSDMATNERTLLDILNYLAKHGYPSNRGEEYEMNAKEEWLRQAGTIKIDNPKFLLTIQRLASLRTTLAASLKNLSEPLAGVNIHDDLTAQEYLEQVYEIQDMRRAVNASFEDVVEEIIAIRYKDIDNMWVTWNEEDADSLSELIHLQEEGMKIMDLLGLGYNMEKNMDDFVGLCFDMKSDTSTTLFRPGWGDAKTYFYWDSIKDPAMPHGYTKTVSTKKSFSKPEAVGKNQAFHLDLISEYSFALK